MSNRLPDNRVFVDEQRKIIDPWLGPLKKLEPLLPFLTPENITILKALVAAAKQQEEEGDGAFSLPIDERPDFSSDYLVATEGNVGKRVPMSLFSGSPVFLERIPILSGGSATIAFPPGYSTIRAVIIDSTTAFVGSTFLRMRFSEDGGASNVPLSFVGSDDLAKNEGSGVGMTTLTLMPSVSSSSVIRAYVDITDASGPSYKIFSYGVHNLQATTARVGWGFIESTAPINAITISMPSATFVSGIFELWGIP